MKRVFCNNIACDLCANDFRPFIEAIEAFARAFKD